MADNNMCLAHPPQSTTPAGEYGTYYSNQSVLLRGRVNQSKAGPPMCSYEELETALQLLEAEAANFAFRFTTDSAVRQSYITTIREMSAEIRSNVYQGKITPEQGARFANQQRNVIMESARLRSSPMGRAMAERLKSQGLKFGDLTAKYADDLFGTPFKDLTVAQKEQVYVEIIEAAGRDRPRFTAATRNLSRLAKGLWLLSAGIAIYNISTAEDKVEASVEEGVALGGGLAGGAAAGLAVSAACGPGAPICAAVIIGLGSIFGSLTALWAYDEAKKNAKETHSRSGAGGGGSW